MKSDKGIHSENDGGGTPDLMDLAKISEIARRALKLMVTIRMPAIPPNYEKVFYNTATSMGENELVTHLLSTLPTGQAAAVMVNGLNSMITDINSDLKRYRAGIDQHGGQLDDKNDVIQNLVGPAVWELLEKDFSSLRNANSQMKEELIKAETRLESQEQQVSQLQRKTRCDPLTGVMNRFAMDEDFPDELARSKRYGRKFGVIMTDIDHFKRINDTHGHSVGDEALKYFVKMLRQCLREVDVIYRYGGEEFVILLPETDPQGTMIVAERLRQMVASQVMKHREDPSRQVRLTASFGVAVFREEEVSAFALVERADQALYRAKKNGRNRVESEL